MSDHILPAGSAPLVTAAISSEIRRPESIATTAATWTLTFTPDLTAPELVILANVVAAAKTRLISATEWQAISADVDGLRTYLGVASPTLAQTALASKAIIRVLRAILRD